MRTALPRATMAAANSTVVVNLTPSSRKSGISPVLRSAIIARKPTTNNGTIGGCPPCLRCTRPTPATIGASRTTRVNFTTTAAATAVAPAGDAAATTCATSCTLKPAHLPRNSLSMPAPMSGTKAMAALP
jgi:hypothetical protein